MYNKSAIAYDGASEAEPVLASSIEDDLSESAFAWEAVPGHSKKVAAKPTSGKISVVASHHKPDPQLKGARMGEGSTDTAPAVETLDGIAVKERAIRQQLARILQSQAFLQSERLSRFLRFIVQHVIGGTQNYLKEYVIGAEVYERKPPYHPSQDSIVRTEARRLRSKLKEYYETEGKDDPIYIYLRPGNYIPVFQHRVALVRVPNAPDNKDLPLSAKAYAISIAILPFHDVSGSRLSSTYARGIPDELAYTLMRTEGCRVISPASMAHFSAQEHDVTAAMRKAGAQIAIEGSIRAEGNHIRVTARIVDETGLQLWVKRVDAQAGSRSLFVIEEQIASALSVGFDGLFGNSQ